MVCAERLLEKLDLRGQLTKELYKSETTAGRTLLSCLGYWGPIVPVTIGKNIGIRCIKKLKNKEYHTLQEVSIDLIGIDIEARLEHLDLHLYPPTVFRLLRSGEIANINGRTDLYVKGLGKPKYKLGGYYASFQHLRWSQYFNRAYAIRHMSDEMLTRLVQLDFPEARLDELDFAIYTGLDIMRNKLAVILRYLDNIIDRNLKEDWSDNEPIDYSPDIVGLARINDMELPTCGRDLKKTALRFKNCAAAYVNKAVKGETVIMYNDEHMAQVSPNGKRLLQFYGKRNSQPTVDFIM